MNKVKVNNDMTTYLPDTTETRRGLDLMDSEFTTYGSARILICNVTFDEGTEAGGSGGKNGMVSVCWISMTLRTIIMTWRLYCLSLLMRKRIRKHTAASDWGTGCPVWLWCLLFFGYRSGISVMRMTWIMMMIVILLLAAVVIDSRAAIYFHNLQRRSRYIWPHLRGSYFE